MCVCVCVCVFLLPCLSVFLDVFFVMLCLNVTFGAMTRHELPVVIGTLFVSLHVCVCVCLFFVMLCLNVTLGAITRHELPVVIGPLLEQVR